MRKIYNKRMKRPGLLLLMLLLTGSLAHAQKKVNVTFEKIKEECKDLPVDKRIRLTVARFTVTTTAPAEFGGNLATMLTNALQEVNCYRVLESLKNSSDMNDEINYSQGQYAKKGSGPKMGKQLGAQVVVTGEITEFNVKSSRVGVGLLSVGSNKAKIGFILKLVNPETREVIFSKSINVEGKAGGGASIGLFGANLVSSTTSDPALANACEQGIIQAVEFMASKKDMLLMPEASAGQNSAGTTETEVTLANANFNAFNAMTAILSSLPAFKSIEKTLSDGLATYTVVHSGTTDELLNELNKKLGGKYEVTGFGSGKIELKTL